MIYKDFTICICRSILSKFERLGWSCHQYQALAMREHSKIQCDNRSGKFASPTPFSVSLNPLVTHSFPFASSIENSSADLQIANCIIDKNIRPLPMQTTQQQPAPQGAENESHRHQLSPCWLVVLFTMAQIPSLCQ